VRWQLAAGVQLRHPALVLVPHGDRSNHPGQTAMACLE
jgi:hypothetical protein